MTVLCACIARLAIVNKAISTHIERSCGNPLRRQREPSEWISESIRRAPSYCAERKHLSVSHSRGNGIRGAADHHRRVVHDCRGIAGGRLENANRAVFIAASSAGHSYFWIALYIRVLCNRL